MPGVGAASGYGPGGDVLRGWRTDDGRGCGRKGRAEKEPEGDEEPAETSGHAPVDSTADGGAAVSDLMPVIRLPERPVPRLALDVVHAPGVGGLLQVQRIR